MFISKVSFSQIPTFLNYRNVIKEHQFVMSLFPETDNPNPRSLFKILYVLNETVNREPYFLIQSKIEPFIFNIKNEKLRDSVNLQVKSPDDIYKNLFNRKNISYKLKANPVKTFDNKLHPVRGQENILEWWKNLSLRNGLNIDAEQTQINIKQSIKKDKFTVFSTATITGRGNIIDSETFLNAVVNGIGKEKSYGYGLLLLGS
jgi:CRISPR-associated protein Cas6/Cse3/CasE subtype I-E